MKVSRLYAQVLVDVCLSEKPEVNLGSITAELHEFSQALVSNALALKTFDSPMLPEDEKAKAMDSLCKKAGASVLSARFLALLMKKGRLDLLPSILAEVERIQVERRGGLIGELVSAIPLDAAALSGVAEVLSKRFQKPIQLNTKVDPAVIAGIKVTINGVTYDGTIKSKLAKFASM
jgi:F-type H+-transporting ATPase subunit delta